MATCKHRSPGAPYDLRPHIGPCIFSGKSRSLSAAAEWGGHVDDEFGECLCAHIEPERGMALSVGAVRAFLAPELAGFKVPKTIEIVASLPREDSGKIFKRKLRAPYWEKAGRAI